MPQTNAEVTALQLEKVRGKTLSQLFERDDELLTMLNSEGEVEKVSSRSMRVPLKIRPGGKFRQATMQGDDLGRGSGTIYEKATLTPIFFTFAVEIQKLAKFATNTPAKAVINSTNEELMNAMAQFRTALDCLLQTAGTGVLGVIASRSGTTLTMKAPFKAQLLYHDQPIQIFNPALTTDRGSTFITKIDRAAGTVTMSSTPSGTAADDVVVVEGVATSPTSLFGIKYHANDAKTGTWMGLSRGTYPEIRTPSVAANSSALTTAPIRLALNKIRLALGNKSLMDKSLIAHMNVSQEDAYESLAIQVSEIAKQSSSQQGVDLFFNGMKSMSGIPIKTNIHADPTRIDFMHMGSWGRAVMEDIDFYESGGQIIHPLYGTSGGLSSADIYYLMVGFQTYHTNPLCGSILDGLIQPSGY